ncbi:hypothetical protein RGQ15_18255 [Paracoccus sp. MBLB3053]|uniref:Uncharacterized protein n=1 Tax=Paracoccus aurantius TaxID=3073814 RepID=A0ABU2HWU2_9RHOB|nr:hypothetical protein [Paracoccus sp. MBLB3053]MDS9469512.1 hypothetical protein [Paracoccus sp. MBLB3053]
MASVVRVPPIVRFLFRAVAIALLVFVALDVAAWALPRLVGLYRDTRLAVLAASRGQDLRPGHTGLIYVESPEVYTRQRLVNDRYLQDAWLRNRLAEVDSPDAGWIEDAQAEMRRAVLGVIAGQGSTAPSDEESDLTGLSSELVEQLAQIPFKTRFRLQSEARDEIRQMILENALDDRHDLSGNTVLGLKFDTSILPGAETVLNPTVVVRMDQNPLDILLGRPGSDAATPAADTEPPAAPDGSADVDEEPPLLRRDPEAFVRHFMRYSGPSGQSVGLSEDDLRILVQIDRYFGDWLDNVSRRLNEYRGERKALCRPELLDQPLCRGVEVEPFARASLTQLFSQVEEVDEALAYVTRLPDSETRIASRLRDQVLRSAVDECTRAATDPALPPVNLGGFLEQQQRISSPFAAIPGAWGQFFEAQTKFQLIRQPSQCRLDVDISFNQRDVDLYVARPDAPDTAGLGRMGGLLPLPCEKAQCPDFEAWVQPRRNMSPEAIARLKAALTPTVLAGIEAAADIHDARALCLVRPQFGDPFLAEGASKDELVGRYEQFEGYEFTIDDCAIGRQVQLRLGALEFFRRMAQVESYTYAAFPRGNVTGVVTEAGNSQSIQGGAGASGVTGWAGYSSSEASRKFEAAPEVINFASGQSRSGRLPDDERELFDFGWTVVKAGIKEPMMVSQLVLVSVPAYLDEIRLTVWKGFLDPDKVPDDRNARIYAPRSDATSPVAGGSDALVAGDTRSFNDLNLEEMIGELMEGYQRRTITLKVPTDFAALDSIVIGRNEILGPMINKKVFQPRASESDEGAAPCLRPRRISPKDGGEGSSAYQLALVIPGERLWRSTVVTLAGSKAERIEVMPDMRGILATMTFPEYPAEKTDRLWVWTSEGNDSVEVSFCEKGEDLAQVSPGTEPVAALEEPPTETPAQE